jgi:hypothetical protein
VATKVCFLITTAPDVVPVVPVGDDEVPPDPELPVEDEDPPDPELPVEDEVPPDPELPVVDEVPPEPELPVVEDAAPPRWEACWRSAGAKLPPTASHTTRAVAAPIARDPPISRRRRCFNQSPGAEV